MFIKKMKRGGAPLRLLGASIAGGFTLVAAVVWAAAPMAGQTVSSTATVTYTDILGQSQTSQSNSVTTSVAQVGSYTLSSTGQTKSAGVGQTAYVGYTLTNTGNGTDKFTISVAEVAADGKQFSNIAVYADDGAGNPTGVALCTVSTETACSVPAQTINASGTFKFVVGYSVPSTASWTSNAATITARPDSTTSFYSTYASNSITATDTVNVVTGASFNVTQGIVNPTYTTSTGGAASTWPVSTSGQTGSLTTFTVNYRNDGGSTGNLYIKDLLPSGLTYQAGKTVISCNPGVGLTDATGGDAAVCSNKGILFEQVTTGVWELLVPNVAVGESGSLSFQVQVASTAAVGTSTTTNAIKYNATGCTSSNSLATCAAGTLTDAAAEAFQVTATRGVKVVVQDTTAGTPKDATDAVTSAGIVIGGSVKQTFAITNNSNSADTFNLTVTNASYPTGTVFKWYAADGTTPLVDNDGDGVIDTGNMPVSTTAVNYVLKITVPNDATLVGVARNYSATVLAASILDPNAKDAAYSKTTDVYGAYVDLTNTLAGTSTANIGDLGVGPSTQPTQTISVNAGAVAQVPLYIKNNDTQANTYTLAASTSSSFVSTSLGTWTVTFSSTACATPTAITTTNSVAAGGQLTLYACVMPPATNATETKSVYFRALSTANASNGSIVSDIIYDAISVISNAEYSMKLDGSGDKATLKGASVDYAFTLTNDGAKICGKGSDGTVTTNYIKIDVSLPGAGWGWAIYPDTNNNGLADDGASAIVDSKLVAAGTGIAVNASTKFVVRVTAPANANLGDTAQMTVTVSDVNSTGVTQSSPNGCGTQVITQTTTVASSSLSLTKAQKATGIACSASAFPALDTDSSWVSTAVSGAPGTCILYKVVAKNTGSVNVSNVTITDVASGLTVLKTVSPAASCVATSATGTPAVGGTTNVTCGSVTLQPNGTLTLKFAAEVKTSTD